MWLAFREFDITFFETYVFTIVIAFSVLWAIFSVVQWVWKRFNSPEEKQLRKEMVLLKDDLTKSGPYKKDRAGMPQEDSIIKLHAVIFKHSQKRIINKELEY